MPNSRLQDVESCKRFFPVTFFGCFEWHFQGLLVTSIWAIKRSLGRSWNRTWKHYSATNLWIQLSNIFGVFIPILFWETIPLFNSYFLLVWNRVKGSSRSSSEHIIFRVCLFWTTKTTEELGPTFASFCVMLQISCLQRGAQNCLMRSLQQNQRRSWKKKSPLIN